MRMFTEVRNKIMSKRVDVTYLMEIIDIDNSLMLKSSSKDDRYNIANELAELLVSGDIKRVLRYDMKRDTVFNDTIGGLRFVNGIWNEVDGEIKIFLDKASEDEDNNYALIVNDIDEVDNLSSAFDSVLYGMEERGIPYIVNCEIKMMVSANVYIITTVTEWKDLDRWTKDRFSMVDLEVWTYE